jgi:hypothetical protein
VSTSTTRPTTTSTSTSTTRDHEQHALEHGGADHVEHLHVVELVDVVEHLAPDDDEHVLLDVDIDLASDHHEHPADHHHDQLQHDDFHRAEPAAARERRRRPGGADAHRALVQRLRLDRFRRDDRRLAVDLR